MAGFAVRDLRGSGIISVTATAAVVLIRAIRHPGRRRRFAVGFFGSLGAMAAALLGVALHGGDLLLYAWLLAFACLALPLAPVVWIVGEPNPEGIRFIVATLLMDIGFAIEPLIISAIVGRLAATWGREGLDPETDS
ncbi:MAG: hypothetical protein K2X91_02500 [Thermoleophilia bacterium]|nr:hypothetical protein [Thermoleophilia bacterium]